MSDDVTPVRQQYLDAKREYPGAILFFRLGDFYETFDEDAETVSRVLDIVLTSRPVGYLRRSSRQVTFNPFAVVVPAMRLTIVS